MLRRELAVRSAARLGRFIPPWILTEENAVQRQARVKHSRRSDIAVDGGRNGPVVSGKVRGVVRPWGREQWIVRTWRSVRDAAFRHSLQQDSRNARTSEPVRVREGLLNMSIGALPRLLHPPQVGVLVDRKDGVQDKLLFGGKGETCFWADVAEEKVSAGGSIIDRGGEQVTSGHASRGQVT